MYRYILAVGHRRYFVLYGHGRLAGAAVTISIIDGQGDGLTANIGAAEALLAEAEVGNSASIGRAIIDGISRYATYAAFIELYRYILAASNGDSIIFYVYVDRTSTFIARSIYCRKGKWDNSNITTACLKRVIEDGEGTII